MPKRTTIAVFGSSQTQPHSPEAEIAYRTGALLAARGMAVVNGGYGGVMEESSRGAHEAGGHVIGVTCQAFATRKGGNPYLDETILTPTLLDRITTLMERADGCIVLYGGVGTLAELFLAWNLKIVGDPAPLIVVGESFRLAIEALLPYTELKIEYMDMLHFVETPEEAVDAVCAALGRGRE